MTPVCCPKAVKIALAILVELTGTALLAMWIWLEGWPNCHPIKIGDAIEMAGCP